MCIIIEGSDCVGKTTLAKKLERRTGLLYQHLSRLPDDFDRYWGYVDLASRRQVRDRFHMSEPAYQVARGDETALTPERYRLVDGYMRLLGAYTVVITATDELLRARHGEKDEMFTAQQTVDVNAWYRGALSGYDGVAIDIDYHIHCTPEKPFPDERDTAFIVAAWETRQAMLYATEFRRKPSGPIL